MIFEDDFWGWFQALLVGEVEVVPLEVARGDGVAPAPRRGARRSWGQHSRAWHISLKDKTAAWSHGPALKMVLKSWGLYKTLRGCKERLGLGRGTRPWNECWVL